MAFSVMVVVGCVFGNKVKHRNMSVFFVMVVKMLNERRNVNSKMPKSLWNCQPQNKNNQ